MTDKMKAESIKTIPDGWLEMPLKRLGIISGGAGFPDQEQGNLAEAIPFFKVADTSTEGNGLEMMFHQHTVSVETAKRLGARIFEAPAIIFPKVGAALLLNKRRILTRPSCIDNNMMAFQPTDCDPMWAFYVLSSIDFAEIVNPGAVPSVSEGQVKNIRVLVPPTHVQRVIASFLKLKIDKIASLIEKKKRQIAVLHEKRAAVIALAVKGIGTGVDMADSGIEWIGTIPAHWKIIKAKQLFTEKNDRSMSGDEELLSVSHLTGVSKRSEKTVNMFLAESLEGYKKCAPTDLVINTMWAWMGALGFCKENGIVSPSYNVYSLRQDDVIEPLFYDVLFKTGSFIAEIVCQSKGVWSSRLRLYPEAFFQIQIPVPPLEEQRLILLNLDKEIGHYDRLEKSILRSINLLEEYRKAVISAAVTGLIEVQEKVAAK